MKETGTLCASLAFIFHHFNRAKHSKPCLWALSMVKGQTWTSLVPRQDQYHTEVCASSHVPEDASDVTRSPRAALGEAARSVRSQNHPLSLQTGLHQSQKLV